MQKGKQKKKKRGRELSFIIQAQQTASPSFNDNNWEGWVHLLLFAKIGTGGGDWLFRIIYR